ncbi:ATP-binding protein [Verrucomicrobiales bacterium BCK34]|nr:ATP-binding protein [Verrucomicrobiales bacterium BCK34]
MEFFRLLFDTSDFQPRWNCGNWTEFHGWLHVISDLLIFGAYVTIPLSISAFYVLKRKEIAYSNILLLFAAFILSCGATHFIEATIFWHPWYRLSGVMKLITAIASWLTVGFLLAQIPKAIKYAGVAHLTRELERKRQEQSELHAAAARSERRLALLLNSTAEGIYGIDSDGRCTFANRSCVSLLGYDSPEEFIGKEMHSLIHHSNEDGEPEGIESCKIFKAAQKGEKSHCDSEVFWRKDGTSFPVEYWSYPVDEDGVVSGAVVTFFDVTERLQANNRLIEARERAELANRQKTRFLANMSHEIRTPMNAILGFSELMEGVVVTPKAKEYLSIIRGSGESLLDLINDLLDLSKIEAGRIEVFNEPADFSKTIGSVVAMMSLPAREKGLELSYSIDPSVPRYLEIDGLRLRQIVLNLLSNAVKFTDEGDVAIECRSTPSGEDDGCVTVEIEVSDSGTGIPKGELKKIFKPFHQVQESDSHVAAGTGLGLSITERLTKLMGGKIKVASKLGEGSTFTVTIPSLKIATSEGEPVYDAHWGERNLDLIKPSLILVADDNAVNRDFMIELFGSTHHRLLVAEDGAAAIELIRKEQPDLVLMDIRMPGIDGREALGILRKIPEVRTIPVLAVTASSLLNKEKKLREEFDGYLRKPFTKAQLFRALAHHLPTSISEQTEEAAAEEVEEVYDCSVVGGDRESLVAELKELMETSWPKVSATLSINSVSEFSRNIVRLGEKFQCTGLFDFGNELGQSAESFQLGKMEKLMARFPGLVESAESGAA